MRAGSRLVRLMAVAILANYPPGRPPGARPPRDFEIDACPDCGTETDIKRGGYFYCEVCRKTFPPTKH